MSKKDLTQLSKKELESMLAKKYGVDKYLNQRSQLLGLLGSKGETNIESGFTGPETEALSIMFENVNKAEGGIVTLLGGGSVIGNPKNARNGILGLWTGSAESANAGAEASTASETSGDGFTDEDVKDDSVFSDEDTGMQAFGGKGGLGSTQSTAGDQGYGPDEAESLISEIEQNPQLQGFLGRNLTSLVKSGNVTEVERDIDGNITGLYSTGPAMGSVGIGLGLMGANTNVSTYSGYGAGSDTGPDMGSEPDEEKEVSEKIKDTVDDLPLTQEEIDYYTRGMGTGTKSLKSLDDVNNYMSNLVGETQSPIGARLSKDKKFLILPNGKIINLRTGRVQDSMSGLELFAGGMI